MKEHNETPLFSKFLHSPEGRRIILFAFLFCLIVGLGTLFSFQSNDRSNDPSSTSKTKSPLTDTPSKSMKQRLSEETPHLKTIKRWQDILKEVESGQELTQEQWYDKMIPTLQNTKANVFQESAIKTINPQLLLNSSSWFQGRVIQIKGIFLKGQKIPLVGNPGGIDHIWELWIRDTEHRVTICLHLLEKPTDELKKLQTRIQSNAVFAKWIPYELKNPTRDPNQKQSKAIFVMGKSLKTLATPGKNSVAPSSFTTLNIFFGIFGLFGIISVFLVIYFTQWSDQGTNKQLNRKTS